MRGSGRHQMVWNRAPSTMLAMAGGCADMTNPRSLVYALYTHWDTVEVLVRLTREHELGL